MKAQDGGGIEIDLSRGGSGCGSMKEVKLSIELAPVPRLLPRVLNLDYISTYCIFGGLVIIPVSQGSSRAVR